MQEFLKGGCSNKIKAALVFDILRCYFPASQIPSMLLRILDTLLRSNTVFLLPAIVNRYNYLFFYEDATAIVKYIFATPLRGIESAVLKILVKAVNQRLGCADQIFCVEWDDRLSGGFKIELFEMDFQTCSGVQKRVLDRSVNSYINGFTSLVDKISRYI